MNEEDLWSEEIQALKDIKSGKTKMVTMSADEMIKWLHELEDQ